MLGLAVLFSICHSSTVLSVTCLTSFGSVSLNCNPSIVCTPLSRGLVDANTTTRGLSAVPQGEEELGLSALQPSGAVRGAFASAVVMLPRKAGRSGIFGMNCV